MVAPFLVWCPLLTSAFAICQNVVYSELRYSPHEFFLEEHKDAPPVGMAR